MREPADADHPAGRHPRHFFEKFWVGPAGFAKAGRRRIVGAVGSVSMTPGETQLTVMPWRTTSPASVIVRPTIDPLPTPASSV